MVIGSIGDIKRYRSIASGTTFIGMKLADDLIIDIDGKQWHFRRKESEVTAETVRLKPEVREFFKNYLSYWRAIAIATEEKERIIAMYEQKIKEETAELDKAVAARRKVLDNAEKYMRNGYLTANQMGYVLDAELSDEKLNALAQNLEKKISSARRMRVSYEYITVHSCVSGTCMQRRLAIDYSVFIEKYAQNRYSFIFHDYDNTCYVDMHMVSEDVLLSYMNDALREVIQAVPGTEVHKRFNIGDKCSLTFDCEVYIPIKDRNAVAALEKLL